MTAAHYKLIGFATLWLLVLCAVWVDWRWSVTAFAVLALIGLIKKAFELKSPLPPHPR